MTFKFRPLSQRMYIGNCESSPFVVRGRQRPKAVGLVERKRGRLWSGHNSIFGDMLLRTRLYTWE